VEDFDLHKELYRGKTSLLYSATDRHSGIPVALKLYRKRKLSTLNRQAKPSLLDSVDLWVYVVCSIEREVPATVDGCEVSIIAIGHTMPIMFTPFSALAVLPLSRAHIIFHLYHPPWSWTINELNYHAGTRSSVR
jgi:hypothetical protein